ncbi:Serine/threonine kinase [Nowakowskiella sp. JEL0407]|nr:Serine/threonine kinase [Nowakowskiella sp. JEL0407]
MENNTPPIHGSGIAPPPPTSQNSVSEDIGTSISRLKQQIDKERLFRVAAEKMIPKLPNKYERQQAEAKLLESDRRIEFLTESLNKLMLQEQAKAAPPGTAGPADVRYTAMDFLRFNTPLTSEKLAYRLKETRHRLELEERVFAGTQNLVEALGRNPATDPTIYSDLRMKIQESKGRIQFLQKNEVDIDKLLVVKNTDEEELHEVRVQRTGRLRIKLTGSFDIPKPNDSEICAVISIDQNRKATTKFSKDKWNESFDLQLDKACEVEISVYDRNGPLLGFVWFRLVDLEADLKSKYGVNFDIADVSETIFDLVPSGQIFTKLVFTGMQRGTTRAADGLYRRNPVQKIYPKAGHKFVAQQFYQVMQCAVCDEFLLAGSGYQCSASCVKDQHSNPIKFYNIPHRFTQSKALTPTWCSHCGYLLPLGRQVMSCTDCKKSCHVEHAKMMPNFCKLTLEVIDQVLPAIEAAEYKREQEEIKKLKQQSYEEEPKPRPSSDDNKFPKLHKKIVVPDRSESLVEGLETETPSKKLPPTGGFPYNLPSYASPATPSHAGFPDTYQTAPQLPEKPGYQPPMPHTYQTQSYPNYKSTYEPYKPYQPNTHTVPNNYSYQPPVEQTKPTNEQIQQQQYKQQQEQQYQQQLQYQEELRLQQHQQEQQRIQQEQQRMQEEQQRIHQEQQRLLQQQEQQRLLQEQQKQLQEQQRLQEQKMMQLQETQRLQQEAQVRIQPPVSPFPSFNQSQTAMTASGKLVVKATGQKKGAPTKVTLDDFHFVAVLGRGAFGKVMLAEDKHTNQLYAIKALKKEFIIQNDDVKSTQLEKRIFQYASKAHHPFLVNLHSCFHNESRLYFVMEYVCGGDLMCHVQETRRFTQARAKFYACEVLLALEFFHSNNIIYRDLKLDNILMGPDGHIKVADYGICKEKMPHGSTTRTYCGTPDYMAPEILMNHRYGRAVDWWSFGVLIFVMLIGKYPFSGEDENEILDAILDDSIDYPSNLPRDTYNLLQGLLNKNPAKRLGGGKNDAEDIKRHQYFHNCDWKAFMRKEVEPPWKPTIKHPRDVSNFDKEFTAEKPNLTPVQSTLKPNEQMEFKDFSYIAEWAMADRAKADGY